MEMLTKKFFAKSIKYIIFCALLIAVLTGVNTVLRHKYLEKDLTPISTYGGYYEMDKNSVDVLFFGSSHSYSSFSPQRIYNKTHIRSYNLSSSEQSLVVSYYWLKEALEYQSPKAVVLDVFMCFPWNESTNLNAAEPYVRKAVDSMHWSSNRIELIDAITKIDDSYSKLSYYLSNLRYHERWEELDKKDFDDTLIDVVGQSKGYSASYKNRCGRTFEPFEAGTSTETAEMQPYMAEYLQKIADLCKTEGIQLILVRTPYYDATLEEYNTMQAFADANNLPYYDFNERSLYDEIGYNFAKHNDSKKHVNIWGARKISDFTGHLLQYTYGISGSPDMQWEKTKDYYRDTYVDAGLYEEEEITDYLDILLKKSNKDRYTIFITIRDMTETDIDPEVIARLRKFGLKETLESNSQYYYLAVIDQGKILTEQLSDAPIAFSGAFDNNERQFTISGQENDVYNKYRIKVNTSQYGIYSNAINIIVYDNVRHKKINHGHYIVSSDRNDTEEEKESK